MIPVDSVRARVRAGTSSMRLVEAHRLVAAADKMVAGVAGGDHKSAAERLGDEQVDESMLN